VQTAAVRGRTRGIPRTTEGAAAQLVSGGRGVPCSHPISLAFSSLSPIRAVWHVWGVGAVLRSCKREGERKEGNSRARHHGRGGRQGFCFRFLFGRRGDEERRGDRPLVNYRTLDYTSRAAVALGQLLSYHISVCLCRSLGSIYHPSRPVWALIEKKIFCRFATLRHGDTSVPDGLSR
jgi:hypothetical protein